MREYLWQKTACVRDMQKRYGVVRKSSMDSSATWAPVSPEKGRKRPLHVFWGVISFNKYSTEGEEPGECLSHDLGLFHYFTGQYRPVIS